MKILIDGENFRQGLSNTLTANKIIGKNCQFRKYRIRNLLEDVLETKNLEIVYYARGAGCEKLLKREGH